MRFGEFVKSLRKSREMGLREFCISFNHDPSNWSKMERGVLPPPRNEETLKLWASQLGIKKGSDEWYKFFDLAFAEQGRIPSDILSDEEVVEKLPIFFRTVRGQKPSREELEKLYELIKRG